MITGVNLLPWREARRSRQRRSAMITSILLLLITAAAVGNVWWTQEQDLRYQRSRNQFLEQQIARVEADLREIAAIQDRKDELLTRVEVIRELQAERARLVQGLLELAESTPQGIFFSTLKRTGAGVSLNGVAESSARISALMKQLTGTPSFDRPELNVINVNGTQAFDLWVSTSRPDAADANQQAKP